MSKSELELRPANILVLSAIHLTDAATILPPHKLKPTDFLRPVLVRIRQADIVFFKTPSRVYIIKNRFGPKGAIGGTPRDDSVEVQKGPEEWTKAGATLYTINELMDEAGIVDCEDDTTLSRVRLLVKEVKDLRESYVKHNAEPTGPDWTKEQNTALAVLLKKEAASITYSECKELHRLAKQFYEYALPRCIQYEIDRRQKEDMRNWTAPSITLSKAELDKAVEGFKKNYPAAAALNESLKANLTMTGRIQASEPNEAAPPKASQSHVRHNPGGPNTREVLVAWELNKDGKPELPLCYSHVLQEVLAYTRGPAGPLDCPPISTELAFLYKGRWLFISAVTGRPCLWNLPGEVQLSEQARIKCNALMKLSPEEREALGYGSSN